MKIAIVAVGKIKERYLQEGIAEYQKRLTPFCKLEIVQVDEERMPPEPSAAEKEQVLKREGEKLLKQLSPHTYIIVLNVVGKQKSSEQLAETFAKLALSGKSDITFIIGGAFGLSLEVLTAADEHLSFSKMTFTHQMIRMILVEQIYRAFKINRGEKYHW